MLLALVRFGLCLLVLSLFLVLCLGCGFCLLVYSLLELLLGFWCLYLVWATCLLRLGWVVCEVMNVVCLGRSWVWLLFGYF